MYHDSHLTDQCWSKTTHSSTIWQLWEVLAGSEAWSRTLWLILDCRLCCQQTWFKSETYKNIMYLSVEFLPITFYTGTPQLFDTVLRQQKRAQCCVMVLLAKCTLRVLLAGYTTRVLLAGYTTSLGNSSRVYK